MSEFKSRDKSKKRAAILEGAIDVFIDMGYEQASMDKIALTAGVSKRTVYNHFVSKENLFQAVVSDFLSQRQSLKKILYSPHKPLKEQLLAFANAELFLIDEPRRLGLSRFLTGVFLKDIEYTRSTVAKYPPKYDMLLDWIEAAIQDGKLKTDHPLLACRVFYSLIEGGVTYPAIFSSGINRAEVDPLLDELIETFLAKYGSR